ncbi:C-type lectin domain family 12 member B-like isoform X2 [Sus scrofa]|uniref:C-type lectin domain family 12 member B-like isoform X2 n=1 Tax=Sus scrofa TaxID=9823 RepID=UPI0006B15EE7|nr:C-type lectin domain family 12 member B-like isoform X2 [Sus scrofa]
MSNSSDCEQHPENTEQTETIPIADLEPSLALPPPPPEDEWRPIPEHTNVDDFQSVQESQSKMKSFNQWNESFQNKDENFLQVQKALDQNKEILEWILNQNEYLTEALRELNAKQGDRCGPPLSHWVKYRNHCYHQTLKMVSWSECSDLCVSLNATFLNMERHRLMNIMRQLAVNHTWLGLSYHEEDNQWKWKDGSLPSLGLSLPEPSTDFQGKCVYANMYSVGTDNCTTSFSCMCEKPVC